MKHIFKQIIALTLSINAGLSYGQTQTTSEQLIGTWRLDYKVSCSKMTLQARTDFDALPLAQRARIKSAHKDRQIIFNENGGYLQILSDGRTSKGTWTLVPNSNNITITGSRGKTHIQSIKKLSKTQLLLKLHTLGNAAPYFQQLYFIKS